MLHTSDYLLFFYAYVTLPRPPPPSLSQSVTPGTPPPSPLERDVIIEWPLCGHKGLNTGTHIEQILASNTWVDRLRVEDLFRFVVTENFAVRRIE